MPFVIIPILTEIIGSALIATIVANLIVGVVISLAVNLAIGAIGGKKKAATDLSSMQGRTQTVRQSAQPWQIVYGQCRVGGTLTYFETTSSPYGTGWHLVNGYLHMVITLGAHEFESIDAVLFNDLALTLSGSLASGASVTGSQYAGKAILYANLGTPSQPAFAALVAASAGKWTSAHRQQNRPSIYARLEFSETAFPQSVPNITVVAKGRKVYDPRTGLTVWSANAALCIADYLTNTQFGMGFDWSEIDEPALIAAANVCDENVNLVTGGTEKRFTINGAFNTDAAPSQIVADMLTAMGGRITYVGGKWQILPAVWRTPETDGYGEDDLRGAIQVTTLLSRRELFNAIKGLFVSPTNVWQPTDYPAIVSSAFIAQDTGETIWRELDLPYTITASAAQRLAKIELLRNRQQIVVAAPFKIGAFRAQPGDVIPLTLPQMGWAGKYFEVVECSMKLSSDDFGIDVSLRETDATIFDWSTSEEQTVDPAPNSNLPSPIDVPAPGVVSASEELYETTGSAGLKVRLIASWSDSFDSFVVSGGSYQFEWKKTAETDWHAVVNLRSLGYVIDDVATEGYDLRVKAINVFGVSSAYATSTVNVQGLNTPPADVTGFTVRAIGGVADFQWNHAPDLDVRQGGKFEIRHTPATSGATWNESNLLRQYTGNSSEGHGPLVTGTYLIKAIDSTNHYSSNAVAFAATEGMVTGFTTLATITEDPSFAGAQSDTAVVSNVEQLDDPPASLTGTYTFDNDTGDLATSDVRRFEVDIAAFAFDTGDLIDTRGDVDDWPTVDGGGEINGCAVVVFAELTDDNPAGSPTWGTPTPFLVADFKCRAARFSAAFTSDAPTHNIGVNALTIHVKEAA